MTVWKEPADAATTAALGAGPAFPVLGKIDGVTLNVGNRVLVKDQLTPAENGYYEVAAGVPPTLMATDDTIEAEDVIRVDQGDKNAHTAWALIDAPNRIFVRQDVKHYSLKSIDALKHLWQVLPDATATVAGYKDPGGGGGGDFSFIGAPSTVKITAAAPHSVTLSAVNIVNGTATFTTSAAHGFKTGQSIHVSDAGAQATGDWIIRLPPPPDDTTKFIVNGFVTSAALGGGARASYVSLTVAGHGRLPGGQRLVVSGVVASPGAAVISQTEVNPL
jgi:hypothetical protein